MQTERALKDFHHLVLNKSVLMAIIQALESERAFTIRDKYVYSITITVL